jgi:hypothetical protein
MMLIHKAGRFHDPYRGDGRFVSFNFGRGFLLLALRRRWHFHRYTDAFKSRWYVGPLEIEFSAPLATPPAKEPRHDD